jgi:hypothetical protein
MSQEGGGRGGKRGGVRAGRVGPCREIIECFLPDVSGVSGEWFEAWVPGPDLIISGMRRFSKMVEKCFF